VKHKPVKQHELFRVVDGKIKRRRYCPRCGDGTIMAVHKQPDGKIRYYCGKCHLTIWE